MIEFSDERVLTPLVYCQLVWELVFHPHNTAPLPHLTTSLLSVVLRLTNCPLARLGSPLTLSPDQVPSLGMQDTN